MGKSSQKTVPLEDFVKPRSFALRLPESIEPMKVIVCYVLRRQETIFCGRVRTGFSERRGARGGLDHPESCNLRCFAGRGESKLLTRAIPRLITPPFLERPKSPFVRHVFPDRGLLRNRVRSGKNLKSKAKTLCQNT
jgi:hypothetical protein